MQKDPSISIREAGSGDLLQLRALLAEVGLSTTDLLAEGTRYWLAEAAQGGPLGVIGLEPGQQAVLLRSAAVSPSCQGQGLGAALVQHACEAAAAAGHRYVYLFSTDAGSYWQRHDFREVPVPELVAVLPLAPQVQEYERLGWLPTEVAWRRDLSAPYRGENGC